MIDRKKEEKLKVGRKNARTRQKSCLIGAQKKHSNWCTTKHQFETAHNGNVFPLHFGTKFFSLYTIYIL